MTPTELKLARELVRHPAWKWLAGMIGELSIGIESAYHRLANDYDQWGMDDGYLPDLADPATQGCLMASILAATGERKILELIWDGTEFTVVDMTCVENGKRTGHWHVGWPPKCGGESTYGSAVAELWLAVQR